MNAGHPFISRFPENAHIFSVNKWINDSDEVRSDHLSLTLENHSVCVVVVMNGKIKVYNDGMEIQRL